MRTCFSSGQLGMQISELIARFKKGISIVEGVSRNSHSSKKYLNEWFQKEVYLARKPVIAQSAQPGGRL